MTWVFHRTIARRYVAPMLLILLLAEKSVDVIVGNWNHSFIWDSLTRHRAYYYANDDALAHWNFVLICRWKCMFTLNDGWDLMMIESALSYNVALKSCMIWRTNIFHNFHWATKLSLGTIPSALCDCPPQCMRAPLMFSNALYWTWLRCTIPPMMAGQTSKICLQDVYILLNVSETVKSWTMNVY